MGSFINYILEVDTDDQKNKNISKSVSEIKKIKKIKKIKTKPKIEENKLTPDQEERKILGPFDLLREKGIKIKRMEPSEIGCRLYFYEKVDHELFKGFKYKRIDDLCIDLFI